MRAKVSPLLRPFLAALTLALFLLAAPAAHGQDAAPADSLDDSAALDDAALCIHCGRCADEVRRRHHASVDRRDYRRIDDQRTKPLHEIEGQGRPANDRQVSCA